MRYRLLAAEDEPQLRMMLWDYFTAKDFDVTTCRDGEEALAKLEEQAFAGLNAGTYYLVETKAPDGYKLAGGVKDITLADDIEAEDTFVYTAEVANSTLVSLPITGGMGTLAEIEETED